MKFKSAFKFQLQGYVRPLITFYIIVYAIFVFMLATNTLSSRFSGSFGGMDMASMIFIFVLGLNSFKSSFLMLMANGVSRKSIFTAGVVKILPVAAFMAALDTVNNLVMSAIARYQSLYSMMYSARYDLAHVAVPAALEGFLWMFFTYAAIAMAGYFITTLYYRMEKPVKLAVSIGVPVLICLILPYVDTHLFAGKLTNAIGQFISAAAGFAGPGAPNPYIAMLSNTLCFAVLGVLCYLLIRRAPVKEA